MARFDRTIPPGGKGEVTLKLSTKGYQGSVHRTATVYSNDPQHPQIKLAVKAHIKVPISVKPMGVMLDGFVCDEVKKVVTITAHEDEPLILEPAELSLPDQVAYELETVEKGKTYRVILRNISPKEDRYSGFLTIKTNYPKKPEITVRFLGFIKGDLEVKPETIDFGRIESTRLKGPEAGGASYQRACTLTLSRGDGLKIEKIDINRELFETEVKEIKVGTNYRIHVRLRPEKLPTGMLNEKMTIYTNLKDVPVKVIHIRGQKI